VLLQIQSLALVRGRGDQTFRVEVAELAMVPGEMIALTGESGSGKSSVLELLGLVARPIAGGRYRLLADGRNEDIPAIWSRDDQARLARLRAGTIGFVLQTGGLLPYLSVAENLTLNRRLSGLPSRDPHVDAVVDSLEIGHLLHRKPGELSVGQHQRASVARALAHKPRLLLADEPTSALDPRLGDRVMGLMLALAADLGIAVVLSTHARERVRGWGLRELRAVPLQIGYGSRFEEAAQ
jgi:putative ABC transport system ATP-binding protein